MNVLSLRSRQRARSVDLRLLRKMTTFLLRDILDAPNYELGIRLVDSDQMARVNETYLQHHGSTDVITFDYQNSADIPSDETQPSLHGEIFISIDDAVKQARQFRTTWQAELARYVIHGILHLQGYDDLDSASRKTMKRVEAQTLKRLAKQFSLKQLQRK